MLKTHYSHKLKFTFITLALLFLLIPQLPSNISNTYEFNDNKPHINKITNSSLLRVGIGTKPVFHDPVDVWDPGSLNVLDQVAEGLFSYNLSDPSLQMVPTLAEDFGTWSDNKNYVVDIKQGITFHDGTSLNATAVKFTFDRLLYWTNATGIIMDENDLAITTELFKWPNGTQIINRIEILGPYTVRFVLNHAYQLFVHLLTFSACYIISMSHGIEKIGPGETHEFPIGTGPFIYENWVGDELVFSRNDDYWQGPSEIKSLIFSYVEDANARN
ncbi:MAG: ABC transporter substrate-binding protein, partial [Promethearchaeota archaeon]